MIYCKDFAFQFLFNNKNFSHLLKELFIIFRTNNNYIDYQFKIVILLLLRKTFEILESYDYNLIFSFLYHFRKGINKNLRDVSWLRCYKKSILRIVIVYRNWFVIL